MINTASTFKGGGVQVAKSFIEECIQFPEHEYHVILGLSLATLIDKHNFPSNFYFYEIGYRPATRVLSWRSHNSFFKKLESHVRPDVVFTTSGPGYWRPVAPHLMGFNLPHYVYPDSPFFKQLSLYKKLYWKVKGLVIHYFTTHDADAYVVQTDDVNERLKKWIGTNEVFTVTNTFAAVFENASLWKPVALTQIENEFRILMLSAYYRHKNLEIINGMAPYLSAKGIRVKFVTTLPHTVVKQIFSEQAQKFIMNVGPVRPEQCPSLYDQCNVVFLPTLLECFSANYVEAMFMHRPIITSDLGFAHTVCKEAAFYINPLDPERIVDELVRIINDDNVKEQMVSRGIERLRYFKSAKERATEYLRLAMRLHESK